MTSDEFIKYIKKRKQVCVADVQVDFSVGYVEARDIIHQLEIKGILELKDKIYYHLKKQQKCELPMIYLHVLYDCVENDMISIHRIQRKLSINTKKIQEILDWMEEMQYIKGKPREVLLTMEEFMLLYESYVPLKEETSKDEEKKYSFDEFGLHMFGLNKKEKETPVAYQLECQKELEELIKGNPAFSYDDAFDYFLRKAVGMRDENMTKSLAYMNFLEDFEINDAASFEKYKKSITS